MRSSIRPSSRCSSRRPTNSDGSRRGVVGLFSSPPHASGDAVGFQVIPIVFNYLPNDGCLLADAGNNRTAASGGHNV